MFIYAINIMTNYRMPKELWDMVKNHIFARAYTYCSGDTVFYDARDKDTFLRILENDARMHYESYADMMLEYDFPPYVPRQLFPEEAEEWIHGIPVIDLTQ